MDYGLVLTMLAIFGPAATAWFGFLQRYVVTNSKAGTIAARVAVDQVFFAPTQLTCFLSSMAIMEGTDPIKKLRTTFFQCYKANISVWPFVQTVNFTFVPLEYRVLMVNVISLGEYFCLFSSGCIVLTFDRVELHSECHQQ